MSWVSLEVKQSSLLSPAEQPFSLSQPPPLDQSLRSNSGFDLNSKISPSILLIIIILSIIFFISGLLHLLVRFLLTPSSRDHEAFDNATALQGQLQQLFHLHDSGVDQSFIDTLPVFHYKTIIGLKNPFDCAVCLCEFETEDKLRLLPKCSHAFHMECIDTWLLSHSTCPLCRANLLSDFSQNNPFSPVVFVLESGGESSREIYTERDGNISSSTLCRSSSLLGANSNRGFRQDSGFGSTHFDFRQKSVDHRGKDDNNPNPQPDPGEVVVPVRLGKFRSVDDGGECSSNTGCSISSSKFDSRRCLSMGSLEYVMDESSTLRVPVSIRKYHPSKRPYLLPTRAAMSECNSDSSRDLKFGGFGSMRLGDGANRISSGCDNHGKGIGENKKESFSISKIWLRGKSEMQSREEGSSPRRAFSFRFPVQRSSSRDAKGKSALNSDLESQSHEDSESLQAKTPSFARRTLLWLAGRQNKVVHSSITPNA